MEKQTIQILGENRIELEIDPNPNGLPILFMTLWFNQRLIGQALLSKEQVKELILNLIDMTRDM